MTALTKEKSRDYETWGYHEFTLTGSAKVWKGGQACASLAGASAGKVVKASALASLMAIGTFAKDYDATSGDVTCTVRLDTEIQVEWLANDGSILAANVFGVCYFVDDQTVTLNATGSSIAGRIWAIDSTLGVAVQTLRSNPQGTHPTGVLPAPVAGDIIPTSIANDAIYDVPMLAANSTLTLPASPPDGIEATIVADGTKNGFTLQVRDATGPTNLTAAFTASKRLNIKITSLNGKWSAVGAAAP